ncbi:hypothetical protein [Rhodococcoides kyotonense]|uniref:Condensation domain-containing protein n=1 Tax=Rhodococcoides kyotonense TaxID=398843 RepID=A0A239LWB2_9NOCA|nr:hypothetical protein [Rhodococcus kyotonensis]SNT34560.1 hypothetical protein SAMN05421642_114157 [Rhodococcus kyotonensis]
MHHGIGNPVFNQLLWWFDDRLSGAELESLHRNLAEGLLSRAVDSPVLPTARHRWTASTDALPLDISATPLDPDAVRCWAEQRVSDDIDPERGLGWQLAAAPLVDGGMVVSLVCSHMVADGAATIAAVRQANRERASVGSVDLGRAPSFVRGLVDDVSDSFGQLKPIASWAATKLVSAVRATAPAPVVQAGDEPRRTVAGANVEPWSAPYVVVECPAREWHAAAQEWGGTSNSLLIGVLTAVSESAGRAKPGDELRWSLPFSDRDVDDVTANSTKIVPVRVPVASREDRDLTRIRKASKTAFQEFAARLAAGTTTEAIPLPLIQMLPDFVVSKLPQPSDGSEGLCSSLGRLPDDVVTLGGVRARSVAARATFHGADAAFARSLGGGSTAWATETEDTVTVTLHGMDPDRMTSDEQMRDIVAEVLGRWSITYRFW